MEKLYAYVSTLPAWLIATIVVSAGWLAAGAARFIVARLLTLLHFNQLCERAGAYDFLRKGGVSRSPAQLAGRGLYWVVLVAVFLEAARILDIGVATDLRQRVVAALPALLSAVLVLAVGLILIAFLAGFVRTVTRNAGSPYANLWSRVTRWVGVVLVLAIAFEQAEIRGSVLAGAIQIVIAAFAFGMALAFGLGCKDIARNAMEKIIADLKDRHRDASKPDMEG
jgi:hypothetical protein